jgi:hypothetical protein
MLASRQLTLLALLYMLACAALVVPSGRWSRGVVYIAGYVLGSCAAWAVMAGAIAGVYAIFARADERRTEALAAFNAALLLVTTLNFISRAVLIVL